MGEGETSFKQLLRYFHGEILLEDVPGICYLEDEKVKIHAMPPKIDLRELPSPFRFEEDLPYLGKRIQYIETSRGAHLVANFVYLLLKLASDTLTVKIKEDIRFLMDNGARTIKFVDRTFNISRSYAMEMFQF